MDEALVLYAVDEAGVATITLNRPEKLNAFTPAMIDLWVGHLQAASADPAVRVVVLAARGRAFCAGGDAGKLEERAAQDALAVKDSLWRGVHRIPLLMEALDKPTIAAINGAARGAGLDMALMCDLRLMARSATVAESYINIGVVAGDGGAWYLPRLIGIDRALDLFWTGRSVGAEEAERIGLVTRMVEDADLPSATQALARAIAAQPAEAVRAYKRITWQSLTLPLATHLDMVSAHSAVLRGTETHRDLVAKLARRPKREGKG